MYTSKLKIKKNVFSERLKESLLMAGSLRLFDQFHIAGLATEKARRP